MLEQTSGMSYPHQNQEKRSYQYMSTKSFRGTAKRLVDLSTLASSCGGHLKVLLVHSAPIENVETFRQHICVPDKPFATAPTPLKGCDSP